MSLTDDIIAQPSFDAAIRTAIAGVKALRPNVYDWVGVYLLTEENVLTLQDNHYLGKPTPHTRIPLDSGICGAGAAGKETLVIDDVHADPRYIACSVTVQSEIVVPILAGERVIPANGGVIGVLDLDSDNPAAFKADDRRALEAVAAALAEAWRKHNPAA